MSTWIMELSMPGDVGNGKRQHAFGCSTFHYAAGGRIFDGYTVPAHLRAGWERNGSVHVFFDAELNDVTYH